MLSQLNILFCAAQMGKRILIAFDFDHTVIDDNSDAYVLRLAPNNGTLPDEIEQLRTNKGWNKFMGAVFQYLHVNGISQSQIQNCVAEIPLVTGMPELLAYIAPRTPPSRTETDHNFDTIIISDANSVFIETILEKTGFRHAFSSIYTNPASFDADGCLTIQPYHQQDWCNLSTENMCKGHILDEHRTPVNAASCNYDFTAYIGDGANDLCPALKLKPNDFVFARRGYSLANCITDDISEKPVARVVLWDTGLDILNTLKDELAKTQ